MSQYIHLLSGYIALCCTTVIGDAQYTQYHMHECTTPILVTYWHPRIRGSWIQQQTKHCRWGWIMRAECVQHTATEEEENNLAFIQLCNKGIFVYSLKCSAGHAVQLWLRFMICDLYNLWCTIFISHIMFVNAIVLTQMYISHPTDIPAPEWSVEL